jgi:hypothetical protein
MDAMTGSTFEQRRRGRQIYRDDADGTPYFIDKLGQKVYDNPNGAAVDLNWPTLDEAAMYGLPAEVVHTLAPHTEADRVALLSSFAVMFGAACNAGPHAIADGAQHPARLSVVLVGKTSRGRKGSAHENVKRVLADADEEFVDKRIVTGLASGEGLIAAVSDGSPDKDGHVAGAVSDKRLLIFEPEWSRVLRVCAREGSTLSAVLRSCWDSGDLRVLTRKEPLRATGAHVAGIYHITLEELRRNLLEVDMCNGFANRHLLIATRRSQQLPAGGNLDDSAVRFLGRKVRTALERARRVGRMHRSAEAEELWADLYFAVPDLDGMVGALTARAEAQMLRLSVVYALTDGSRTIEVDHLLAAHALWQYAADTVAYAYGDALGDEVADRLLTAIRQAGPAGLTTTAQSGVFGRHQTAQRLAVARDALLERDLIVAETRSTEGRDAVVHIASEHAKHANQAKEATGA